MKKLILAFVVALLIPLTQAQETLPIIPKPVSCKINPGTFKTTVQSIVNQENNAKQSFVVQNDLSIPREGYKIAITPEKLRVTASSEAGLFYAVQTLLQMMPTTVFDPQMNLDTELQLPCCEIVDYPRFSYRGLHLDVCRHYFPVTFIKKYIDLMAMHKLNMFHWHLTDDQGWRIEIKKYPKLQEIASQRKETWIGHYNSGLGYDGVPYGGYYTQEEIREIVEYARARHITIIPEIEMPGHARAVISAYPELSCTGGPHEVAKTWGVFDDVFCTTEEVFTFLENVLTEVIDLFPYSPYIHIGGDECPKVRWENCPKCQARIKEQGLQDEHELQSYFVNRMARFLQGHGKQVIGWDEVIEGGFPNEIIVMSWRGEEGAIQAVKQNHYTILTPNGNLYLDYYQGVPETEPVAIGGFLPLKKVYDYNPLPVQIPVEKQNYILGVQGNLWTEYIATSEHAEYMAYPRACAVAEVGWSPGEVKDYDNFIDRLSIHFERLNELNVNYAKSHFAVKAMTQWNAQLQKPEVSLATDCRDCEIRYTVDGKEPNLNSKRYTEPIVLTKTSVIKAMVYRDGEPYSPLYTELFHLNLSTGKPYQMEHVNPAYSGGHPYALTDGIVAKGTAWNRWVGTLGKDMDVKIDLLKVTPIKRVKMQFNHLPDSWIYAPTQVTLYVSDDQKEWTKVETQQINPKTDIVEVLFKAKLKKRYVRVVAQSIGKIPPKAQGAGNDAHLFCNEIIIE